MPPVATTLFHLTEAGVQLEPALDALGAWGIRYMVQPVDGDEFRSHWFAFLGLVSKHGGQHHGYFLPAEGASDRALALFLFPSLAAYETYRGRFGVDPEFVAADKIRDDSGCVLRYERTFMRPVLDA